MSFKNPRNLIAVVSVIAALLAGTVLLGGYANSNAAENDAPVKACQGKMAGCPMTAQTASCPKMMGAQAEMTGCSGTPCTEGCPKPCCGEETCCEECCEECCEKPCPFDCPKPCCAKDGPKGDCGTAGATGCCPMTASENAV